ncbi:ABC-2 type transport system permease protein [Methanomicrobium sp. W14]|uniref:ABC transporter permease subunit n=1 Tax=Methanomicrobium sp. W14 TaxID=2817839 RepID=UPI001AE3DE8A|nr:ABC transporter permease subunit [Methanomicrobium sp. W14]MBP2133946.1 ABC-2 type transport system permease protein [Methanomicrobium sp. W14]
MSIERVLIVGKKEFADIITGRRFFALLVMLLIITGTCVISESVGYYDELKAYSSSGSTVMDESGAIHYGEAAYKPSAINLFFGIANALTSYIFGPLIAIAMGFDAITRERETGSIKSVLSHPLYRDELINGKALGGILSIGVATAVVFILTFSILLVMGIVPSFSESGSLIVLFIFTLFYLAGVYSMSLMASVFSKKGKTALVYSLVLFLAFSYMAPALGPSVISTILGPEPDSIYTANYYDNEELLQEVNNYYSAETAMKGIVLQLSMSTNYQYIGSGVTKTTLFWNMNTAGAHDQYGMLDYSSMGIGLSDVLEKVWGNIIFLFVYPVVFFGIAYVKFMRMDLR